MPTLILIHSPLIPAWSWNEVADLAAREGFAARTVNLTEVALDPLKSHLPMLPRLADAVSLAARGCAAPILVAHSAGGALVPRAATGAYDPQGIVFVDAPIPRPGKSWFETAPAFEPRVRAATRDRIAPRWPDWFAPGVVQTLIPERALRERFIADCPRLPLSYFTEPAPHAELPDVPTAYLRLSEAYESDARDAEAKGWVTRRASLDHVAMITQPNAVAGLLIEIVAALPVPLSV
ncbi:MAG: alpha/beta fold hydrolase [Hyphomonadaceae bacterium]